ncbi:MAG TPA: hypothetical protein VFG95_07830, partial [Nitrospiria bacterium]|nr:hypothetical protein [Nitrospiria bacterium]
GKGSLELTEAIRFQIRGAEVKAQACYGKQERITCFTVFLQSYFWFEATAIIKSFSAATIRRDCGGDSFQLDVSIGKIV